MADFTLRSSAAGYLRWRMCGISGMWLPSGPDVERALDESLFNLRHRGPDGEGKHVEESLAFGMRRLAIIDLAGGDQPIWNETRDVGVVFNGEIYNYVELLAECQARGHRLGSRSDTEALVHLYEDDPEGFAVRLRGMFAVALFDRRHERLVLVRDRFGKKPLYYARTPAGGLIFASELKALLPLMRSEGVPVEIDPQAIYHYLTFGSVPQPQTVYKGVLAVPPGTFLVATRDGTSIREYWKPAFTPKFEGSYQDAQAAVRSEITEAVRLRLRSDVPLGTFLSAGVDSNIVTYEAARLVGAELRTFTVASENPELDESGVARRSAERLGVRNTVLHLDIDPVRDLDFLVRTYDQPFADPSAIPSLQVSRAARQEVTVVLNGDGGDELFGGYRRHVAVQALGRLAWVPRPLARALTALLPPERLSRRSKLGLISRLSRGLSLPAEERYLVYTADMLRESDKRPFWQAPVRASEELVRDLIDERLPFLDQQVDLELKLNLVSSLLVKMDMATSAYSLEGRSPLLDHRLGELALSLPSDYRVRGGRPKAVLRDAYADVLLEDVVRGKKRGFEVPLDAWLAGPWRAMTMDLLGAPDARTLNYVDRALVQRVLDPGSFADRNKAYISYSFLVLELWLRSLEA